MKKVIVALGAALAVTSVWASCRYYTVTINNKTYYCSECCYGTGAGRTCNTTCN